MTKLVLHIGSPKTGTTSLQAYFHDAREELKADKGIYYTTSFGIRNNRRFAYLLMGRERDRDVIIKSEKIDQMEPSDRFEQWDSCMLAELRQCIELGCHTMVISSEDLQSKYTAEEVARLKRRLAPYNFSSVSVICYLREQAAAINSHFATAVRGGVQRRKPRLPPFDARKLDRYDYYKTLKPWMDAFGADNVDIRTFERDKMRGGSTIDDVLFGLGLDEEYINSIDKNRYKSLNSSLTAECVRLVFFFRKRYADKLSSEELSRGASRIIQEHNTGSKYMMPEDCWLQVRKFYAESNHNLQKMLDGSDTHFFGAGLDTGAINPKEKASPRLMNPITVKEAKIVDAMAAAVSAVGKPEQAAQ